MKRIMGYLKVLSHFKQAKLSPSLKERPSEREKHATSDRVVDVAAPGGAGEYGAFPVGQFKTLSNEPPESSWNARRNTLFLSWNVPNSCPHPRLMLVLLLLPQVVWARVEDTSTRRQLLSLSCVVQQVNSNFKVDQLNRHSDLFSCNNLGLRYSHSSI